VALVSLLTASACGGGGDGGGGQAPADDGTLLVWTTEDQADRVAAQKKILDKFGAANGATIKLVPVAEDQLTTVLTSAAAAGETPDVIGALSLNGVNQLQTEGLLDTEVAKAVVDELGADTFLKRTLELTSKEGTQLAVPSDAWAQLLFYRKDLFSAAGLAEPKTYADIQKAATALKKGKTAGIVAGTAPADSFTVQAFEQVAEANGCELVNDAGDVTLNSPQCQESFTFYADLIKNTSVKGNQDADTTRATYFAGDAAMVIWSSFLLDEMAGLRKDALPTCPQCKSDPTWLAKNTGIVSTMQGPGGQSPAAFGEVVSWSVLTEASPKTKDLVKFMMSDGYLEWLGIAPEGKLPTRSGTADSPSEYSDAWAKLPAGVDKKAVLSTIYPADVLKTISGSPDSFERWGILQGQGPLAGAVAGQFVVPKALASMINSGADAAAATAEAQKAAEQVKADLG
jgi:multiple sugar transport system substrate-binding protein